MRLWTDADVEAFGLENKEAYEAAGNFGQKSDILRYEVRLSHEPFFFFMHMGVSVGDVFYGVLFMGVCAYCRSL